MTTFNITINDEMRDEIVRKNLLEAVRMNYNEVNDLIEQLEADGELPDYKQRDLVDCLMIMMAAKEMYKYYTVHTEHHVLDKYDMDFTLESFCSVPVTL